MNLTSTDALEVVTSSAEPIDYVVDFTIIDKTGATATTPDVSDGNIASATTTTILAAPAANVFRLPQFVSLRNVGAAANTLTLQKDVSGTNRVLTSITLQASETLTWAPATGFLKLNAAGVPTSAPVVSANSSSVLINPGFATANLTSARTITSTNTMAVYVGKAPRAFAAGQTMTLRYRVTTAAATITWAEVAIATGAIVVGGNPTLTVRGWADASAVVNSLGQKSTSVAISTGQAINEGDDLWVLIGNQATTALAVRAASIADDLQVGQQAALATRPSLNVGTGQSYTLDGPTILAPWVAVVL